MMAYNVRFEHKLHYWVVTLLEPHINERLGIIAPDAVGAVNEVKKIYPEFEIWSMVNHGGVDNQLRRCQSVKNHQR